MTREIRFRAWNPNEDVMRYSQDFYNLRDFFGWVCLNDLQDKFTVMQYTGLKDRNNVEIYEGDIFKYVSSHCHFCGAEEVYPNHKSYLVSWNIEDCCFEAKNKENWIEAECWQTDMEVIGNIYQNPELMEVNNDKE